MQGPGAEHDAHSRNTCVGPALGTGLQVRWSLEDTQVSVVLGLQVWCSLDDIQGCLNWLPLDDTEVFFSLA